MAFASLPRLRVSGVHGVPRCVPTLVRKFTPVSTEWNTLMRSTHAEPSLFAATVEAPHLARTLNDLLSRCQSIRQGVASHLYDMRCRCPRLFMLCDSELLQLVLGSKNLDTVSRLLVKCFVVRRICVESCLSLPMSVCRSVGRCVCGCLS